MVVAIVVLTTITAGLICSVWLIGRAANRSQVQQHTKEKYMARVSEYYGHRGLNLYGAIGDALDQKSSWRKTMDVLFELFDANPNLLLEYLIECYGIDALLDALGEYEESDESVFKRGTRIQDPPG